MAENGINGHQPIGTQWKVGFMNDANKYLTAETFGFKVNASGVALKKKQIWCIEQDADQDFIYIKSGLGRYMTSDKYGNVTVEAEEREEDAKFKVEYSLNGRWAFKNMTHGNYLAGSDDNVKCFDKTRTDKNWWSIQLYVHPQIHLRNVNRKRYAHLNSDTNELQCTELVPWGFDSLLFLDFMDGRYTLRTCDKRFLSRDGTLQDVADDNAKFYMEMHFGCLAFKDCEERYLTAVGQGTIKSRNKNISKDELFTIEDSHPQCQIISPCIGKTSKSVSVKQDLLEDKENISVEPLSRNSTSAIDDKRNIAVQPPFCSSVAPEDNKVNTGVDVSANQPLDEIEDTEIFQMEFNKASGTWAFRASTKTGSKYWELQTGSGTVQVTKAEPTPNSFFEIVWEEDGSVGIKGPDGKFLSNKQTGILYSTGTTLDDTNKFKLVLVNRPSLVLKSEFGFVGSGLKGSQFVCNKAKYDILKVTPDGNGSYTIQGDDQKYWNVGADSLVYSEEAPTKFMFQFCGGSMMAIRAPNGCYLKGEQNGQIKAVATEIDVSSLWEF